MDNLITIYIPTNEETKENILRTINIFDEEGKLKELDYQVDFGDFKFYKIVTEDDYMNLDMNSIEHQAGNLIKRNDEYFLLDGYGWLKVTVRKLSGEIFVDRFLELFRIVVSLILIVMIDFTLMDALNKAGIFRFAYEYGIHTFIRTLTQIVETTSILDVAKLVVICILYIEFIIVLFKILFGWIPKLVTTVVDRYVQK